jgi:hypothetical protein
MITLNTINYRLKYETSHIHALWIACVWEDYIQQRTAKIHRIKRFSLDEEYFKVVGNTQQEERDYKLQREIEEK